jgi:hypothetical protein
MTRGAWEPATMVVVAGKRGFRGANPALSAFETAPGWSWTILRFRYYSRSGELSRDGGDSW